MYPRSGSRRRWAPRAHRRRQPAVPPKRDAAIQDVVSTTIAGSNTTLALNVVATFANQSLYLNCDPQPFGDEKPPRLVDFSIIAVPTTASQRLPSPAPGAI